VSASTVLRAARITAGIRQQELATRAKTIQAEVSTIEGGAHLSTVDTVEGIGCAIRDQSREAALRAFLGYSNRLAARGCAPRRL
jgi:predicted transcriptional regulator